jgi:hypothetical protein
MNMKIKSILRLFVGIAAISALAIPGYRSMGSAPHSVTSLESISISRASSSVLGRDELMQHDQPGSAAEEHVAIQWTENREWLLYDISQNGGTECSTGGGKAYRAGRIVLRTNDAIRIGKIDLKVVDVTENMVVLRNTLTNALLTWRNGSLRCSGSNTGREGHYRRTGSVFRWLTRKWRDRELRLFSIGGPVLDGGNCPVKGCPADVARILWQEGRFLLGSGSQSDLTVNVIRADGEVAWFQNQPVRIEDNMRCVIGRTPYLMKTDRNGLVLRPSGRKDVFGNRDAPQKVLPANMVRTTTTATWIGQGITLKEFIRTESLTVISFAAGLLIGFGILVAYVWYLGKLTHVPKGSDVALYVGTALLLSSFPRLWMAKEGLDAGVILTFQYLAFAWATVALVVRRHLISMPFFVAWTAFMLLAGAGSLYMIQLGAGSDNMGWIEMARSQLLVTAAVPCALSVFALIPAGVWRTVMYRTASSSALIPCSALFYCVGVGVYSPWGTSGAC